MTNGPEIMFQGKALSEDLTEIFTEATGMQMVGLLATSPMELRTFHKRQDQQLVELTWAVNHSRDIGAFEDLQPTNNI